MTHLLVVDPGLSTGCFLGHYSDTEPLTRVGLWQFGDKSDEVRGVDALLEWCKFPNFLNHAGGFDGITWFPDQSWIHGYSVPTKELTIVCEKFTPLQNQGHSLTLDAVEPLRCEGALIALGLMPAEFPHERWQRPSVMYFAGGTTLPDKKKRARAWLKSHDLLPTGKTVGQPNADDAVSASLHAFAFMRKMNGTGHMPTMMKYFGEEQV